VTTGKKWAENEDGEALGITMTGQGCGGSKSPPGFWRLEVLGHIRDIQRLCEDCEEA